MDDKCPWCGADKYRDDYLIWECGSTRLARSPNCYERQIERLQDELIEAVAMRHGTDGKLARMQPVVDAVGRYLHGRNRRTGVDQEWLDMSWERVSDAYGKYQEVE